MRHGQSMWNAAGLFTGWVDVPLSNKGIEEAIDGSKKIAEYDDSCLNLDRAQMTAMIAFAKTIMVKQVFQYNGKSDGSNTSQNEARILNEAEIRGDAELQAFYQFMFLGN